MADVTVYFNPLPPRRGRQEQTRKASWTLRFQSTPSSQRETAASPFLFFCIIISIHSLLAEGDTTGRTDSISVEFQSTPSSQRETIFIFLILLNRQDFNPLPPRRGRLLLWVIGHLLLIFQSTPSSQRETVMHQKQIPDTDISIHSLLAEGDSKNAQKYLLLTYILHTKPTITQANPSLKLIFSNLFSKLTPFSRCESPTHFMCTYHSHLNHIPNFFKPAPSPQLFPLFRYFDPGWSFPLYRNRPWKFIFYPLF